MPPGSGTLFETEKGKLISRHRPIKRKKGHLPLPQGRPDGEVPGDEPGAGPAAAQWAGRRPLAAHPPANQRPPQPGGGRPWLLLSHELLSVLLSAGSHLKSLFFNFP
jgi:hypothetical protein